MAASGTVKFALAYAGRGWDVLPLYSIRPDGSCECGNPDCGRNAGKHPRNENGLTGASRDPAMVKTWWDKWPTANVGIRTGTMSGLVVIDVDQRHEGFDTLYELIKAHGPLPETVEQVTGSGGRHLLFQHPGRDVKNDSQGKVLGQGIDIRGDGGYIVAPPSKHKDGGVYAWEASSLPSKTPLSPLPDWMLTLILAEPLAKPTTNGHGPRIINDGQRDATLASLAGTMRRRGMVEGAILAALIEVNDLQCEPPLPESDVRRIARSISRYEPSAPTSLPIASPTAGSTEPNLLREGDRIIWLWPSINIGIGFEGLYEKGSELHAEMSVDTVTPLEGGSKGHYHWSKFNLGSTRSRAEMVRYLKERNDGIAWASLLEDVVARTVEIWRAGEPIVDLYDIEAEDSPPYLVSPFLPKGETTVLFADGGSFKSYLALAMAVSVTTGKLIAGVIGPEEKGNVLYLDWETNSREISSRLRWLCRGFGIIDRPHIFYRSMYRALADDGPRLRKEVDKKKITLVVVDSIAPACGGEPENADTMLRVFNTLRGLGDVTRLVISHVSKAGAASKGQATPFGSVFVRNMARSVWELRRSEEGSDRFSIGLYHRKTNGGKLWDPIGFTVQFDSSKGSVKLSLTEVSDDPSLAEHTKLSDRIKHALRAGTVKYVDQLATEVGASPDSVSKTLRRLEDVERIGDSVGGSGKKNGWRLLKGQAL